MDKLKRIAIICHGSKDNFRRLVMDKLKRVAIIFNGGKCFGNC